MSAPVSSRADVIERLQRAADQFRSLGVSRLALFGSFARSTPQHESDVDLLVEFQPGRKSFDSFMQVADLAEDLLGRRVDLVTTVGLSPYIGPYILAEAQDVVRAA